MRWELRSLLGGAGWAVPGRSGRCECGRVTWPRATRNLKHADAGQLTAMRDAAAVLLEHERHVSPDVITVLCQIREEAAAELKARRNISRSARASACRDDGYSGASLGWLGRDWLWDHEALTDLDLVWLPHLTGWPAIRSRRQDGHWASPRHAGQFTKRSTSFKPAKFRDVKARCVAGQQDVGCTTVGPVAESMRWFLLVISDRDALGWILTEQRMAFAPSRIDAIDTLTAGNRLVLYTTRGCFRNPTRDRGRVIGTATATSQVHELGTAVTFRDRAYTRGCTLRIERLAPVDRGPELAGIVGTLGTFPESWRIHIRRTLIPLDERDFMTLEQSLASIDTGREAALPTYLDKIHRLSTSSRSKSVTMKLRDKTAVDNV